MMFRGSSYGFNTETPIISISVRIYRMTEAQISFPDDTVSEFVTDLKNTYLTVRNAYSGIGIHFSTELRLKYLESFVTCSIMNGIFGMTVRILPIVNPIVLSYR